ncbi:nuclear intron maturase 4, mitochondrial-like [Selaginella moellendorffii]|uniref:nuclear intron maturase 4, mitochondrial-like n=1 Tax=Selaginella moellendorffii TaxID=88036 RepID=UPI000D1C74DD|nr:nuclear intron maturase 4, mitochondrial-like [Selaginella moellendorffii]XP_024545853.1 nuclear intron maturase 4, mitochondrial-like [Selaginella moellendorffii]|eukprot:XP_024531433.1 nuclear intron maturase 4, mitochondrial-like [Selaginella moellendorffii]
MWFKAAIQGGKARRGGYLANLEATFAAPGRESGMGYWERLQGHTRIQKWRHQKSRESALAEEDEDAGIREEQRRRRHRNLAAVDEDEDLEKRMPRLYKCSKPKIIAGKRELYDLLFSYGFANTLGRAEASWDFLELEDEEIVDYYAHVARGILDYFQCCDNFQEIKPYVDYHLRFSCLFTLSKKYDEHPQVIYRRFSKELLVPVIDGDGELVEKQAYPSSLEIKKMKRGYSPKSWIDLYCPLK